MLFPVQPSVFKSFRRRLTNLSSRNRSLLLTDLPVGQFLDLHETDFLRNKPSFTIIADLIGRKASVPLCDVLDARQERSNEVSRKLRRIDRTARFIEDERGTEDLYVGWPFVRGKFGDGTVVHGPLLFFPVQLAQPGNVWKLIRRGDELAFLNPTLALAYGQFNQIKLPDEVLEKTVDDFDRDPLVFRTQLYEWLRDGPLDINYNADLFADKFQFFDKQNAKGLDVLERTGELKLYSEAVLGIFPQAGSFLVPDYDALIEEGKREQGEKQEDEIEKNEILTASSLLSLPERFLHTPLPLDASQEAVVRAVKAGQSLVVQGPPGTGKSQLIANLMADAAASGKRTLLVCQKRAALDVVQERLRQVGMAPFMALVHDFQDDRRALYAQIAGQIEQVDTYRQQNNSLNTVLLERDFSVESRRIDEAVADLQRFKDALFETTECGVSAKELYLTSDPDGPTIPLDDVYTQFRLDNVDAFVRRLTDYAAYQQRLGADHPWTDRVRFARFATGDLAKAEQTLVNWQQTRNTANQQTTDLLGRALSHTELNDWGTHDWQLTALLTLLNGPDGAELWAVVQQLRAQPQHPAMAANETRLEQLTDAWAETLADPGSETALPTTDLRAFRALLDEALSARSSWVRWRWWQLTNAGRTWLQTVASANGLSLSETDLRILRTKVANRIRQEATKSEAKPLLTNLPLPASPDGLRLLSRARHFIERLNDIPPVRQLPDSGGQTHNQFLTAVTTLLTLSKHVQQQRAASQTYLTDRQLDHAWQRDDAYVNLLRQTLRRDFDLLLEADRLQAGFSEGERAVVDRLAGTDPTSWVTAFQNALRLIWLHHLEQKHPDLRAVSSLKMSQTEQVLQEGVQRKQALSRDSLLVKLREQTYRNLTFNRLNNVITYRDLLHQTTKKRNVWPIRKLMDAYADEVFKLVPCWLASPESVSAMFPLRDDLFDLVIFDEASQCFAENGVPAMARGRQVVVTGDNQQLRPSDLYRIRVDDSATDDEVPAALEVESLLELAAQYLPQFALTEHYRSRSLDLITFSNQHFYQNKLALLPHFNDVSRNSPAIRYLNVKGIWHQNTNPAEAETVLQLLHQIATELPGRSVGVVTFNYSQQHLIQDLLDDALTGLPNPTSAPTDNVSSNESTFVKNIENVQGDERDVIIFSVGYAPRVDSPDERGRVAMQFGSLNARGGENRLNVAVTRARERVYVVTSLWPDQLTVDNTVNEGPKLLKAYLQHALDVAQGRFQPLAPPSNAIPSSSLLKDRLADQHPDWQPELPFADLTVKGGDAYHSLVLTDDNLYYQHTIKQAHAYLPLALQSRHWPFQRIWSREFWRNKGT